MDPADSKQINKEEAPQADASLENINPNKREYSLEETIRTSEKPSGWSEVKYQLSTIDLPKADKPPKSKETSRIVHGFKLYHDGEILLFHVPLEVKQKENAELLTAISMFFTRVTGKEVKFGRVDGFTCPCTEIQHQNTDSYREIARILAFENYSSPKIGDEEFLKELFKMVHARMNNKNYEVGVPKGADYTRWVLRDLIRYLGRLRYEIVEKFVQRIPKKERKYMDLKIHDFEKFKSVLSDQEWNLITNGSLEEKVKECKTIKSSVVGFKRFDYMKFMQSNAKIAVEIFGKASLASIYERIKERNLVRLELLKQKKQPVVPLRIVLQKLRDRNIYAGVHLIPVILKFRQGDLPILQKITTIQGETLVGNDKRFTTVEDYLDFAMANTVVGADAQRTVNLSLSGGEFPQEA